MNTFNWGWGGTLVSPFSFPGITAPFTHPRRCPDGVTAACWTRHSRGAGSIPAWGSNKTKDEQVLVRFVLTNSDDVGTHQVVRAGGNSCRLCCVYTYQRRVQAGKPVTHLWKRSGRHLGVALFFSHCGPSTSVRRR